MNIVEEHKDGGGDGVPRNGGQSPRRMKLSQARKYLGVSSQKMTELVSSGVIVVTANPLDRREKLVDVAALDELKSGRLSREENP